MTELLDAIVAELSPGDCPAAQWPDAKGEYHGLCPYHADEHSGSFSVSERGFICFACGEKGSLRKLADHLGIETPRPASSGLTLDAYADAKRLPVGFLKGLGLADGRWARRAAVFMPYRGADGKHLGITRVRKTMLKNPHGRDERFAWSRRPKAAPLALYGLWRLADMRPGGWVLLVEGESDCHTGWLHDLPLLGVPGASNWRHEWAALLDGLEVYVWQEPDGAGANLAAKVYGDLPRARVMHGSDDVKDISAAHLAGQDVKALVTALRPQATAPNDPGSLSGLADRVEAALHDRDLLLPRDRLNAVVGILAPWLLDHGRLLLDVGQDAPAGGRPYLVADDGAVWPLERDALGPRRALYEAGLNATETAYRFVLEALVMELYKAAPRVTLARWQRSTDAALYVSCGPCHVVRARGGSLERLPNGADAVWFASDACYPAWTPSPPVEPSTLPAFCPPLEGPPEVSGYGADVQRELLSVWVAALVSGLRPLPMLALIGRKGGGKSTLARAILRMFLGPACDVAGLRDDARDFEVSVTTSPVYGLDNVDSAPFPWVGDALARTVTGYSPEARKLYSDDQKVTRPVTAALVVTTRTASFARPDVAERTLPLLTAEFADSDRLADSDLLEAVNGARDGLLSWAALTAWALLSERRQAPAGLPLRFVDFARLTWAYEQQQGRPELAASMLLSLRQAQALCIGDADPLVEAILAGFDQIADGKGGWSGSASALVKALADVGCEMPYLGGGQRIANGLREARGTLDLMGVNLRELGRGQGQRTLFMLSRSPNTVCTVRTASERLSTIDSCEELSREELSPEPYKPYKPYDAPDPDDLDANIWAPKPGIPF
jgi:hypothetical protein